MQNAYNQIYQFQFHKGTIRTVGSTIAGGYQANFNSIKVQLELMSIFSLKLRHIYFNSIKVQLERNMQNAYNQIYQFQFHKGTIRTVFLANLTAKSKVISIP